MARITPLWRSDEILLYRFDHPVEHEDQAYDECADVFRASFVEQGRFNLEIGESRWRVAAGDVMLSHPGMRFRASFEGKATPMCVRRRAGATRSGKLRPRCRKKSEAERTFSGFWLLASGFWLLRAKRAK